METQAVIVISTYPSREEALKTGEQAVNQRLAACAQVSSEITSTYRWEGKVCTENEYQLNLKTIKEREAELIAFIRKHHPYQVAELIVIPLSSTSSEYLAWMRKVTRENI
ncbi:MAG: divalent-cation tolerance protein CutA [Candidatus Sabulitectum sp.]|nr:divalent-cation tolerance protein CutA [Candidatus Sabulitectum sp.]